MSVLIATVLAVLATGVSVGMTLAGQPSTAATITSAVLTVLLVWTVLPLVLRRVR
jgi:ABC-type Na+ efflux pump permease subunit